MRVEYSFSEILLYIDIHWHFFCDFQSTDTLFSQNLDCSKYTLFPLKFAQYERSEIKGRRKNVTSEWKNGKFIVK